ncbi:MAG: hypothetical protein H6704_24760 [Myxococcales bacterium]|nr:hypothetical protein [Myxococcales bacterium]
MRWSALLSLPLSLPLALAGPAHAQSDADRCDSMAHARTPIGARDLLFARQGQGLCAEACTPEAVTADDCADTAWLQSVCGRLELDRVDRFAACLADGGDLSEGSCGGLYSTCTTAIDDLPYVETHQPGALLTPGDADEVAGVDRLGPLRHEVRAVPFSRADLSYEGGDATWLRQQQRTWTRASARFDGAYDRFADPTLALHVLDRIDRTRWRLNGESVAECREYVYEKFYDLSRFEDAIAPLGDDYRAIWNVAFAYGAPQTPPPLPLFWPPPDWAAGWWALHGDAQQALDGSDLAPQFDPGAEAKPRNAWLGTPVLTLEKRGVILGGPPSDTGRCGLSLVGLVICDDGLAEDFDSASDKAIHTTWAWHQAQGTELAEAGFSDELLEHNQVLGERYQMLLYERQQLADAIAQRVRDELPEELPVEPLPGYEEWTWLVDPPPDVWSRSLFDQRVVNLQHADLPRLGAPANGLRQALRGAGALAADRSVRVLARDAVLSEIGVVAGDALQPVALILGPDGQPLGDVIDGADEVALISPTRQLRRSDRRLENLRITNRRFDRLTAGLRTQFGQLAALDDALEAELLKARAMGCFRDAGLSPCDWSPRRFAQQASDMLVVQREEALQNCAAKTASAGFQQMEGRALVFSADGVQQVPTLPDGRSCWLNSRGRLRPPSRLPVPGLPVEQWPIADCPSCNQWQQSTTTVDQYFQCVDAFQHAVLDALRDTVGDLLDENGRPRLGDSAADTQRIGNDLMNITLAHGAGWTLGGFAQFLDGSRGTCEVVPEAYGYADLDVTVLGRTADVLRATAHVAADGGGVAPPDVPANTGTVDIEILDVQLTRALADAGGVNVVSDDFRREQKLFEQRADFPVGPVVLTVKGGATGVVGASVSARGSRGEADDDLCVTPPGLTVGFTPHAALDAFASVGIGAGPILSVGVKATLRLIGFDLPFTTSVQVATDPYDPSDLRLAIDTRLDAVLSTLHGRLALYVEAAFQEWTRTIFRWNGLTETVNLFGNRVEVPLGVLRDAYASGLFP